MRQSALLRLIALCLLFASVLGVISFFALRELNESSTSDVRRHMISFIAQTVEAGPYSESVQVLRQNPGRRFSETNLWVFSAAGDILAANAESPPPLFPKDLRKPKESHDFVFHYRAFRLIPDLALVKLEAKEDTYLLIEFKKPSAMHGAAWVQASFLLFIIASAVLIAICIIYAYLNKKSKEARMVLSRLEKGELGARFEIKRTDEIGTLMLDFNRMAAEIERLVHRVQETERARKNMLEELSHDLRTPLTSLNTSVETLSDHYDEMPAPEQREFISVIRAELSYFLHLIEDLFFIADIGEPRYKKSTQKIDVAELIRAEAKNREAMEKRAAHPQKLAWSVLGDHGSMGGSSILGDPILIQRLFKNAFDNASKYAASSVKITISSLVDSVVVKIEDDGVGISDESAVVFGDRRKQRFQTKNTDHSLSLGLGSVIMKAILELHGGTLIIRKAKDAQAGNSGTQLTLFLPRDKS